MMSSYSSLYTTSPKMSKSSTDIEFYFLFLIQGEEQDTYMQVYDETIEILEKHFVEWSRTKGGYKDGTGGPMTAL